MSATTLTASRSHLWAIGFRPFYLLAALYAAVLLPGWVAHLAGILQSDSALSDPHWHAHELVFGFAPAVLAGFLLTAVRNWTGRSTANGLWLALLCLLWLSARLLLVTGATGLGRMADILFLPALAIVIALPVLATRNLRNLPIVAIVLLLAAANGVFHAADSGLAIGLAPMDGVYLGLILFTILMTVMGGRVIPAFTQNAVHHARPQRLLPVEIAVLVTTLFWAAAEIYALFVGSPVVLVSWAALAAATAHTVRLGLWDPLATRAAPSFGHCQLRMAGYPLPCRCVQSR